MKPARQPPAQPAGDASALIRLLAEMLVDDFEREVAAVNDTKDQRQHQQEGQP